MKINYLITHSWKFHTDEVFAYSILSELFSEAKLIRTRDEKILNEHKAKKTSILFDIWKEFSIEQNNFDHHLISNELISSCIEKKELKDLQFIRKKYFKELIRNNHLIFPNEIEKNNFFNKKLIPYIVKCSQKQAKIDSLEDYYKNIIEQDINHINNLLKEKISIEKAKILFVQIFDYSKYSSFWLIWNNYSKDFIKKYSIKNNINLNEEEIENISKTIYWKNVKEIDREDNWISFSENEDFNCFNSISNFINLLNSEELSNEDIQNENFKEASKFAIKYLTKLIEKEIQKINDKNQIEKEYKKWEKIQIFSQYYNWIDKFINSIETKKDISSFIIFSKENWIAMIKTVKKWKFNSKRLLPEYWLIEKPEGCTFIHQDLFIAEFTSVELAKKAIEKFA